MAGLRTPIAAQVEAAYRDSSGDPSFSAILGQVDVHGDDELAEAIEVDGRTRIAAGRVVHLKRYIDGVPGLAAKELALDAAIDVTLRFRSNGARPTPRAVQSLIVDYPFLRGPISEAALLAEAVVSTSGVGRMVRPAPQREVPADFGPLIGSGKCRYQLTRLVGSGSSGEVYQAIDRQLSERDRPAYVAIKLLAGGGRSAQARQLLAEEATKARRVLHSNVVRVLDRGVSDQDEDYIVYEHIESGDLDTWLERRAWKITPIDVAGIVARIARGVQAAHSAGVVHCDLKPPNVLVTESGEPKVCDFGIAVRKSDLLRQGADAKPVGNIAFISPEQFRGEEGCLSPPSDVYALGGILFYLLTRQFPNGDSIEKVARIHDAKHGRAAAPSAREQRKEIDEDLDAICRRAMAVKPADRYASASALADDLDLWARREPIRWMRPSIWKVARLAVRRRPAVAAAWVLAVFAVLGGSAAAGYWASVASEADRSRAAARTVAGSTLSFLYTLKKMDKYEDMLPILVAIESLHGPALVTSENQGAAWKLRVSTVRKLVDEATQAGRGQDFETLVWQGLLGLWLFNGNDIDEAERVLKDNVNRWSARETGGDYWPKQIRLLAAAASVRRLFLAAETRSLTSEEVAELGGIEALLKTEPRVFEGRSAFSPMRRPVLAAAVELYGPRLLDIPASLHEADASLAQFDKSKQ